MAAVQFDLLSWEPTQAALAFAEGDVRGATLSARVSRAVSVSLRDCGRPRRQVAQAMSDLLGEAVSTAMLDAYASVARGDHRISVPRYAALTQATADRRLLEMLAIPNGWTVIERRHLALIELAEMREQEDRLRRRRTALTRQARGTGAL